MHSFMKILSIIGARPQFIKAAVLSRAFDQHRNIVNEVLVHTGQHYDKNMSEIFFDELNIRKPNYNLGIGGGGHGQNTGRMLEKLESVMLHEKPNWVLVYGDTDSTLAAALAAAKLHIPIAHVESGLRSFNKRMPEEQNRVLTDHLSSLLFTPTPVAGENLLREGLDKTLIRQVGDVMFDASLYYRPLAKKPSWFDPLGCGADNYVLCTIHRPENTENRDRMLQIVKGLEDSEQTIILPLHPRTRKTMQAMGISFGKNVRLVDPVGYLEMAWLEKNCKLIATDSGGVQKEAYFHGKPCVTLRDETEWVELIHSGANLLVGAKSALITSALLAKTWSISSNTLYGTGGAGNQIVLDLMSFQENENAST